MIRLSPPPSRHRARPREGTRPMWLRPMTPLPPHIAPLARSAIWLLTVLGVLHVLGLASLAPEAR